MSQETKDTSAQKHQQIQQGVQQRRVLHKNPTRGTTIPPMYLRLMYQLYTTVYRMVARITLEGYIIQSNNNNAKSPPAETFKKLKSLKTI